MKEGQGRGAKKGRTSDDVPGGGPEREKRKINVDLVKGTSAEETRLLSLPAYALQWKGGAAGRESYRRVRWLGDCLSTQVWGAKRGELEEEVKVNEAV